MDLEQTKTNSNSTQVNYTQLTASGIIAIVLGFIFVVGQVWLSYYLYNHNSGPGDNPAILIFLPVFNLPSIISILCFLVVKKIRTVFIIGLIINIILIILTSCIFFIVGK